MSSGLIDMAITPKEMKEEYGAPGLAATPSTPIYPYGLCISLCNDELELLDLGNDCEPGDMMHMECIAKVTSVSKNDTTDGTKTRVELQIMGMALNPEAHEAAEEDAPTEKSYGKFYK